jgi:DnaJ-class molecular chaperone
MTMDNTQDSQPPAIPPFAALAGSAAEVESEVCSSCEGYGSISYNPNLNPNAFPATTSAKCTHCGGTGRVEQAKPQPNAEVSDRGQ